jgi:hypothetical protein
MQIRRGALPWTAPAADPEKGGAFAPGGTEKDRAP